MADVETVVVPGWPRPRGYANAMRTAGRGERTLYVAGQIGWVVSEHAPEGVFTTDDLAQQFGLALENVLTVVRAAGGDASSVARLTVYVTNLPAYRAGLAAIGAAYRAAMGKHYPAMALLGVAGLVEPRALVEIEAVAILPPPAPTNER